MLEQAHAVEKILRLLFSCPGSWLDFLSLYI